MKNGLSSVLRPIKPARHFCCQENNSCCSERSSLWDLTFLPPALWLRVLFEDKPRLVWLRRLIKQNECAETSKVCLCRWLGLADKTGRATTHEVTDVPRKYPQFPQNEIFGLQDAFRKLDVDDKGYLDEATVIKATQTSERQPYDTVRQALKEVELDSSRRVELDDYVDACIKVPWEART